MKNNNILKITITLSIVLSIALLLTSPFSVKAEAIKTTPENNKTGIVRDAGLLSFADIVEPLMPAVVNIYTVKYHNINKLPQGGMQELFPFDQLNKFFDQFNAPFSPFSFNELYSNPRATSLGSGFIIDEEGLIVTNHHVIAGADEINVKLSDNTEYPAKIMGSDSKTDLALLKIDTQTKLPIVSFGNSASARVGDIVLAVGNPLGFGGTVTQGIVSFTGRELDNSQDVLIDSFIQTDAAINPGNSGGPLFNSKGEVIGVNTSIAAISGGTNIGIGFAIPSNTVQNIITQLKEKGMVNRGRLDIVIQEITQEIGEALGVAKASGVLVVDVRAGGTGEKSGLQRGDIITEYNGKKVTGSRKLQLFVADTPVGEQVTLTILRDKKILHLTADIIQSEQKLDKKSVNNQLNDNIFERADISFSDLSPALIVKYNLSSDAKGIIVTRVKAGEINSAPLKAGDLIITIHNQPVNNAQEFITIYDKLKNDKITKTILLVKRGENQLFVAIDVK